MALLNIVIPHILKWEGGFSDQKNDKGGKTNRGVTWVTFQLLAKSVLGIEPTPENHRKLTEEQTIKIIRYYWNSVKGDQLTDQETANILMDWYFMSGNWAISRLIRLLNTYGNKIQDKGRNSSMSDEIVRATNAVTDRALFNQKLHATREDYFHVIVKNNPTQAKFLKGWLNRANDLFKKKR